MRGLRALVSCPPTYADAPLRPIRTAAVLMPGRSLDLDGAYYGLGRWNAEIMRLSGVSRFFATAKVAERRGESAATEL